MVIRNTLLKISYMMKFLTIQKTVLFFFTSFLLAGCIYDDDADNCNDTGKKGTMEAKIAFQCLSDSINIFEQEIIGNKSLSKGGTVSLYIYDKATGNLIMEQVVSNSMLRKFQGTTLVLDPGTYEIRCWANMDANTIIYGEDKLATARLSNAKHYPNKEIITSDDPLYYGALTLTIPSNGFPQDMNADTILFKTAHIHFDIGFIGSKGVVPKIEVRNLEPIFDFEMKKVGAVVTYFPEVKVSKVATSTFVTAKFNILRTAYRNALINYDNTDNIRIVVKDPSVDTLICSVGLKDWMNTKGVKISPSVDNNFISVPDSLSEATSGMSSLPPFMIDLGDSIPIPIDTIPTPIDTIPTPIDTIPPIPIDTIPTPIDTIPTPIDTVPLPPPPLVPDIEEQGVFFHLYRYNEGYDVFEEQIEAVNAYVYEKQSGRQVEIPKMELSKNDLELFQGLRVPLPPIDERDTTSREYEIRCWANVGANTIINAQDLPSANVLNVNYAKATDTVRTNDLLYFGQTSIRVNSDYTYATGKVLFKAAYTRFAISVNGLGYSKILPKIKVSGLPSSYDFYMDEQQWPSKDYYPEIEIEGNDTTFVFNSFRLTNQNMGKVEIKLEHPDISPHIINLRNRNILIDDQKGFNYIYIKGVNTTNSIRVTIDVGSSITDDIW